MKIILESLEDVQALYSKIKSSREQLKEELQEVQNKCMGVENHWQDENYSQFMESLAARAFTPFHKTLDRMEELERGLLNILQKAEELSIQYPLFTK